MRTSPPTAQDIGRTVHWHIQLERGPSPPMAAMIVDVHDAQNVSLAIFHPAGLQFNPVAPWSRQPKPLHWSWPAWTR